MYEDSEVEETPEGGKNDSVSEVNFLMVHVSLHSMLGWTTPRSIKLKGELQDIEIMVLIDSGASHNFLCIQFVAEFQIRLIIQYYSKSHWEIVEHTKVRAYAEEFASHFKVWK